MILVRLAMGTGVSGPDGTSRPRAGTATAASPVAGQGRVGAVPVTGSSVRAMAGWTTGAGTARVICRATSTITRVRTTPMRARCDRAAPWAPRLRATARLPVRQLLELLGRHEHSAGLGTF